MDVELLLVDAVSEPVETHVDGFGLVLSDGGVHDAICSAVVCSDWSGRLWMAQFYYCYSHGDGKFDIHVECINFGFGG